MRLTKAQRSMLEFASDLPFGWVAVIPRGGQHVMCDAMTKRGLLEVYGFVRDETDDDGIERLGYEITAAGRAALKGGAT